MIKSQKLFLICLVLTAIIFLSCGDINTPENKSGISDASFAKVYHYKTDELFVSYPINEYIVGDTMSLICYIDETNTAWQKLPESITARITTSKGDVEFIQLFENPNMGYLMIYPPPPRQYIAYLLNEEMYPDLPQQLSLSHIPIKLETEPVLRNGILSISPYGDMLTAEIRHNNQTIGTTLNIIGKYRVTN